MSLLLVCLLCRYEPKRQMLETPNFDNSGSCFFNIDNMLSLFVMGYKTKSFHEFEAVVRNSGKGLWSGGGARSGVPCPCGNLKLLSPNVRRYKLLIGVARAIELLTNVQKASVSRNKTGPPVRYKRITDVQLLPSAPLATNPCWRFGVLLLFFFVICQTRKAY